MACLGIFSQVLSMNPESFFFHPCKLYWFDCFLVMNNSLHKIGKSPCELNMFVM